MNIFERIYYYETGYSIIANYDVSKGGLIHLDKKGSTCRFCGLGTPDVTFTSDSHAVPEFLGNHQLILNSECDTCNKFFSTHLEDHLDKYTRHHRTTGQVKGKTKIPSYKSKDGRARFDVKPGELPKILARRDEEHYNIDFEKKTATIKFQIEPFIPSAVYKCLVKIGLSIIDRSEMKNFSRALRWISQPSHWFAQARPPYPLVSMSTYVPGPRPFQNLKLIVYKKNDLVSYRVHYLLFLAFGNIAYQIVLPSDNDWAIPNEKLTFVPIPIPHELEWEFGTPTLHATDLSGVDYIRGAETSTNYSFDRVVPKPELIGMSLKDLGYK
jgi:hypothetical protein